MRRKNREAHNKKEYNKWKRAVVKRDKKCCQMPNCNETTKLQAHHIQRWADAPSLRYCVSNGITLCIRCHKKIAGNEMMYARIFKQIISKYDSFDIRRIIKDAE